MSRHWTKEALLEQIRGGLIVSCQAAQGDAFFGPDYVSRFAMSAVRGGACGIRANTVPDVAAIMAAVEVPVIGLIKRDYEGCSCYITPTMREVEELAAVEVPVIAVDATDRPHPDGQDGAAFLRAIRARFPERLLMADISTFAEGMAAAEAGADLVSTTLSGYTEESPKSDLPDFELLRRLAAQSPVPVIAEGRLWTPEQLRQAMDLGAFAAVVGSAVTRPHEITRHFLQGLRPDKR